jgi:catechol 2,3-dioxygenase-like lactoylglutathione lyase family enzyme
LRFGSALLAVALIGMPAAAQIAAPNDRDVAMGHLHYRVDDVPASRDFWFSLGGAAVATPLGEAVRFPGLLILIDSATVPVASMPIDHVAFRVESLEALEERGVELELLQDFPGIANVSAPAGERVELFEEGTATNVGFESASATPVSERHNRPITDAITSHHLHLYLADDAVLAARDWYVEHFGAVPGMRWRYDAADLPGMNLNFSVARAPDAAVPAQILDHIGFEIGNLAAFCRRLIAAGIALDVPYTETDAGFAFATLTDPWGTRIELTEGLRP